MRKLVFLMPLLLLFSFLNPGEELTAKEKEYASSYLNQTKQAVFDATKNLSAAQLQYKMAPDRWSIEECLKHIAISEKNLRGMVDGLLKQPATPEKRSEVKVTDEQLIEGTTDRSNKAKAAEVFDPKNTPYHNSQEALDDFSASRDNLINYIKTSKDDMRNHIISLPFGTYDAFQLVLLVGAHSSRHTQQIEEVKADPGFPKQ